MFPTLIGTVVIAGIVGYLAERSGFTHNGILQSIIICVGGAFVFYFVTLMFGISFGRPGVNALIASVGALVIVPTHWRK
ncbi:MAG: hypothetical protein AAFY38_07015 [Pseudomonadota bacterium]